MWSYQKQDIIIFHWLKNNINHDISKSICYRAGSCNITALYVKSQISRILIRIISY